MKTINELKSEISVIETDLKELGDDATTRETNKAHRGLVAARTAILYLESNPRQEFIESEIARIQGLMVSKTKQFDQWKSTLQSGSYDPTKYKSMFRKEVGITNFEKQIKTLVYILGYTPN